MKYIILVSAAAVLAFLTACNPLQIQNGGSYTFTLNLDKDYSHNETYDFGLQQAEKDSKTITGAVVYTGDTPVQVSSVDLSGTDHFTLDFTGSTITSFPATVSPGEELSFSLSFSPSASGSLNTDLNITINESQTVFTLHLTGTGNYAPTAKFGIVISNAEDSSVNGYYVYQYDPQSQNWIFNKTDQSGYTIQNNGDYGWELWNSSGSNPLYYDSNYTSYPLSSSWLVFVTGQGDPVSSLKADEGIGTSISYINSGDILKGDFIYSDAENDVETGSIYTWSTADSPSGPWTVVQTGTETEGKKDYTVKPTDEGLYLKLTVTPEDSNGFIGAPAKVISPNPVWTPLQ